MVIVERDTQRPSLRRSGRGLGRIIAEFLAATDLRDVTLCFNDWCGAQLMIADGGMDRVGRLVLVSCEAFDNYPPGIPGRLAALSAVVPGGVSLMRRAMLVRSLRQLPVTFGLMSKKSIPAEPVAHGRRRAEIFPNSRFVEVADSYTLVPEDQPVVLAAQLRDFINTNTAEATPPALSC